MLYTAVIDPSLYQFTDMIGVERKESGNHEPTLLEELLIPKIALGLVKEAVKSVFNIFPVKRDNKRTKLIETRPAHYGELCGITF